MGSYDAELAFFKRTMECIALPVRQVKRDLPLLMQVDHGLRSSLGLAVAERPMEKHLRLNMEQGVIYRITDEFCCFYIVFLLLDIQEQDTIIVGPYIQQECDKDWVKDFCEKTVCHLRGVPFWKNTIIECAECQTPVSCRLR